MTIDKPEIKVGSLIRVSLRAGYYVVTSREDKPPNPSPHRKNYSNQKEFVYYEKVLTEDGEPNKNKQTHYWNNTLSCHLVDDMYVEDQYRQELKQIDDKRQALLDKIKELKDNK